MNTSESEVQQLAIKPPVKRPFTLALIDKDTNMPLKSSIQRIGENILAATHQSYSLLQTVIQLLKQFDEKKFKIYQKCGNSGLKNLVWTKTTSST